MAQDGATPFNFELMAENYHLSPLDIKIALNLPLQGEYKAKSYSKAIAKYQEESDMEYAEVILRECVRLFHPILEAADTFKKAMAAYRNHPPTFWMQRDVGLNLLKNCLSFEQACKGYNVINDDPEVERKFLDLCLTLAQTESEVQWCLTSASRLEFLDKEEYRKECIRKLARLSGWTGV